MDGLASPGLAHKGFAFLPKLGVVVLVHGEEAVAEVNP